MELEKFKRIDRFQAADGMVTLRKAIELAIVVKGEQVAIHCIPLGLHTTAESEAVGMAEIERQLAAMYAQLSAGVAGEGMQQSQLKRLFSMIDSVDFVS